MPVAWKTRQSKRSSRAAWTAWTQGVVTPNMVRPIAGLVSVQSSRRFAIMPPRAWAALRQDLGRDPVDAGNVGHRIDHADVGRTDIGADIAGRDGCDHDLGQPYRQGPHCRRRQRGVAGPAGGDDPTEIVAGQAIALERHGHGRDGRAAVAGEDGGRAAWMPGRDVRWLHLRQGRLARGRKVDGDDVDAELPQPVGHEAELARLGVECSCNKGRLPLHSLPVPCAAIAAAPIRSR